MEFAHEQLPSPLALAYIGDTLYDLYVRLQLVRDGGTMKAINTRSGKMVCAGAQSEALMRIEGVLTEAEQAVVRRARNAKQTPRKNADPAEYHRATGLEALMGYLYVTGQGDRLDQLMRAAIPTLSALPAMPGFHAESPDCGRLDGTSVGSPATVGATMKK